MFYCAIWSILLSESSITISIKLLLVGNLVVSIQYALKVPFQLFCSHVGLTSLSLNCLLAKCNRVPLAVLAFCAYWLAVVLLRGLFCT